jgi:Ca2+-transporting ATPase
MTAASPTTAPPSPTAWHTLAIDAARSQLDADLEHGLTDAQVVTRLEQHGHNVLSVASGRSPFAILLHQFKSIIVALLLAAAGVAFALGDLAEAIAILVVIVLNAAIGFLIEWKAERTLSALRDDAVPMAQVLRGGAEREIAAADIVPGDVLILAAGARVPADGRIIESAQLQVEEAALTGESHTVPKQTDAVTDVAAALGDRVDMAYRGTAITEGRGRLLVTATGAHTELGKIGTLVADATMRATPLEKKLARLGNGMVGVVLVLGAVVVGAGWLRGHGFLRMLEVGVSLAIAAMPEGLLAVSTMTLALGMQRMAKMGALIRRLPAVETLGSTTVICTDKTGTLTENQMTVRALVIDDVRIDVTGTGYGRVGEFREGDRPIVPGERESLVLALRIGALCNDATLEHTDDGDTVLGDPTEAALTVVAEKAGIEHAALDRDWPRVAERAFDSETKRMITVHTTPQGQLVAYMKGSPGAVLEVSTTQRTATGASPMTADDRERHLARNTELAGTAMRVLGLAYRELDASYADDADDADDALGRDWIFVGLVGMEDPLRDTAKAAIALCRGAGIRTVMITGDQPATAAEIAKQLGIDRDFEGRPLQAAHGRDLVDLDAAAWQRTVATTSVFARVSPEQKLRIVEALQRDAQVVAMTGDGVNDAPALGQADIGIAMGRRGTDVAKQASAMVITDDDFSTIVRAVEQGRIIYANILEFVHYLFSCNAAEILVVFVAIMVGWPLPLGPLQILWLNIVTDVFPALALAVEPSATGTMSQPPRDPKQRLVSGAMVGLIAWQGAMIAGVTLAAFVVGMRWHGAAGDGLGSATTMAFMTLALAQVFHTFNARSQRRSAFDRPFTNPWLWAAVVLCVGLQIAAVYVPLLQRLLHTAPPGAADWAVIAGCSLAPIAIVEVVKLAQRIYARPKSPALAASTR